MTRPARPTRQPSAWQRIATTLRRRHPGVRVYVVDVYGAGMQPIATNRLVTSHDRLGVVLASAWREAFGRAPEHMAFVPGHVGDASDMHGRCVAITQLNDL